MVVWGLQVPEHKIWDKLEKNYNHFQSADEFWYASVAKEFMKTHSSDFLVLDQSLVFEESWFILTEKDIA